MFFFSPGGAAVNSQGLTPLGLISQIATSNDTRSDAMNLFHEFTRNITRRHFFAAGSHAVGWAALASLLDADRALGAAGAATSAKTHFPSKAKHVIYLHMVGGPSQMDLYDYKPKMGEWFDKG